MTFRFLSASRFLINCSNKARSASGGPSVPSDMIGTA